MTSEKEHVCVARPIVQCTGKEMVNKCVATGYFNTLSDRMSLFKFPSDGILRRKWEKQEQQAGSSLLEGYQALVFV